MLKIPFVENPGKACALACYTMTAKHFFPEATFEEVAKISGWEPGYSVWPFKFWLWIMDKGIKVSDYDLIDLESWAEGGVEGLKQSISQKDFEYYLSNTKNLESYSVNIEKVLNHSNFSYNRRKPTFSDLEKAYQEGAVCEVVLDPDIIDGKVSDGRTHRVVVLGVNKDEVIFHDPRKYNPCSERRETRELFEKAWLSLDEPELCVYMK